MTERMDYLGTGISDLAAAKRYLRNRWRSRPLPPIVRRPGARFYVTTCRRGRPVFLLGPYVSHMTALTAVPRAERMLRERHLDAFMPVGTASLSTTVPTKLGR